MNRSRYRVKTKSSTIAKALFLVLSTLACLILALLPEGVMYAIYHVIQPQTDLTRVLLLVAFWFGGAAFCLGFGALALFIWLLAIQIVTK